MTDRERFENKAIECGAKVIESTPAVLTVVSRNGAFTTTYVFNKDGKFVRTN